VLGDALDTGQQGRMVRGASTGAGARAGSSLEPSVPSGGQVPRVVVLTTRSFRGTAIIKALQDAGIHIHAVVLDRGDLTSRDSMRKLSRYLRRRGLGQTLRGLARRIRRMVTRRRRRRRKDSFARAFPGDVFEVADPNSDAGVQLLTDLAPDVIVLGTTRILKPSVLSIPPMGVLNPHPGLLPDYRGLDVLHWAVYNGDPLGVTVHFLDPGIDTGPIVVQRTLEVQPGDTMRSVIQRAASLAGELMADAVRRLIDTGHLETVPQPRDRGQTYARMPRKLRRRVEAQLAVQASAGTAGSLRPRNS
jgi:methionyl-tRNA formyltransferase